MRSAIGVRVRLGMFAVLLILATLAFYACGSDDSEEAVDGDTDKTEDGDTDKAEDGDTDKTEDGDTDKAEDGDVEEEPVVENLPFEPAGPGVVPDPMLPGPFPVGVKTFDFYDDSRPNEATGKGRWLRTDIWYPTTQKYKDGPFEEIDFAKEGIEVGTLPEDIVQALRDSSIDPIVVDQIRDAEMDRSHGPYPVLFFSHGANGIRWQSVFYTIHLASHGYIVVSSDHEGNLLWDLLKDGFASDATAVSAAKRPADLSFVLDEITEFNNDSEDFFHDTMNLDMVGVSGHSLGGLTSVITPCQDDRFKVSVPHSPVIGVGMFIGGCSHDYPVPTMIMGGTDDKTLPWCQMYCDYKDMMDNEIRYMYELEGGGHYTFSDICRLDLLQLGGAIDFGNIAEEALSDGCGEDNVPYQKAQQSINYYATAFLNWFMRGSEGSKDLLIDKEEDPFDPVNFYEGDVADWWGDAEGCSSCQGGL